MGLNIAKIKNQDSQIDPKENCSFTKIKANREKLKAIANNFEQEGLLQKMTTQITLLNEAVILAQDNIVLVKEQSEQELKELKDIVSNLKNDKEIFEKSITTEVEKVSKTANQEMASLGKTASQYLYKSITKLDISLTDISKQHYQILNIYKNFTASLGGVLVLKIFLFWSIFNMLIFIIKTFTTADFIDIIQIMFIGFLK